MFIKSAANDQLQGKAIQAVNQKWGEDFRKWGGRETIGIPVCKKKCCPFDFRIVRHEDSSDDEDDSKPRRRPRVEVTVRRMYGCKLHSNLRKCVIEQHGVRKGWEPFGQWSMKKAQDLARKETERMNQPRVASASSGSDSEGTTTTEDWTSSDDEKNNLLPTTMCNNGTCAWKVKAKYDDIFREIHGDSDDDE